MFTLPNRLKEKNPQLSRELKGRLTPRNIGLTIALSLLAQVVMMIGYWGKLPYHRDAEQYPLSSQYNSFCIPTSESSRFDYSHKCIYDALGNPAIDWHRWWYEIFHLMSWVLPLIVFTVGVYLLISDIGREEKRGTLNFVRMSPQRSQNILLGKLVGVPAIAYLVVAAALPLHLLTGFNAHVSLLDIGISYFLVAAIAGCLFVAATLFALMGGSQGWVGAISVWLGYAVFFSAWQSHRPVRYTYRADSIERLLPLPDWYGLKIGHSIEMILLFGVITFGTATFWLWQSANRRFRKPTATVISKRQSYLMTACFELWLLGFVVNSVSWSEWQRPIHYQMILLLANLGWFLFLIAALSPHRQALLDWARYRQQKMAEQHRTGRKLLIQDLCFGESSPAVVAIALNLAIAAVPMLIWVASWPVAREQEQAVLSVLLSATIMLLIATFVQLLLMQRSAKRSVWAVSVVLALLILPPILLSLVGGWYAKSPLAFLWSLTLFAPYLTWISTSTALLGWLAQVGILAGLSTTLTRRLVKAGASESKALMAGVKR